MVNNFYTLLIYSKEYLHIFQSPATPIMEGIIDLHNYVFFYVIVIFVFVVSMFAFIIYQFLYGMNQSDSFITSVDSTAIPVLLEDNFQLRYSIVQSRNVAHGMVLEIVWTLIPSFILVLIAIPSFALLYAMDEVIDPALTIKIIGRQWYWVYESSDAINGESQDMIFQSHMLSEKELVFGGLRLLDSTQALIIPIETHIRLIITATDVLHSWAIPSFGIKVDAVPGRLNQVALFLKREGTFYGQCSEPCGVNHGFMPIVVAGVPVETFITFRNGIISSQ
ncbi:MAG TPA: cytochrome c oxidase subunit II [Puia sp.]